MSPAFEWSSRFELGVPELDQQHQGLVRVVNELVENILKGDAAGQASCAKLLGELVDYSKVHFAAEDDFMKRVNYPGMLKHQQQHAVFARRFLDMKVLADESRDLPTVETAYFLIDWVNHHILHEDKKIASFLNK